MRDIILPERTDQELRIWCAEQCRNNNGELDLEKARELYKFVTAQTEAK